MTWSRHSRRSDPIQRSTNGFCHGLLAAVMTSAMPIVFRTWRTDVPKIAADRLTTRGYAETVPLVANDSPENMAKNRRVELKKLECKK